MLRLIAIAAFLTLAPSAEADDLKPSTAEERVDAVLVTEPADQRAPERLDWVRGTESAPGRDVAPPTKIAIIACRVEANPRRAGALTTEPDWHLPVECMRVIETVTDAAAARRLWLRQMNPNLADRGSCAKVAMDYAPTWEASHRNWLIVKVGCPTRIVDADGRTIGWHMPECQGTLPGTSYPLRCRFDPSEI